MGAQTNALYQETERVLAGNTRSGASLPLDARVPLVQQEAGGCQPEMRAQAGLELAKDGFGDGPADLSENLRDDKDLMRGRRHQRGARLAPNEVAGENGLPVGVGHLAERDGLGLRRVQRRERVAEPRQAQLQWAGNVAQIKRARGNSVA